MYNKKYDDVIVYFYGHFQLFNWLASERLYVFCGFRKIHFVVQISNINIIIL